MTDQDFREQVTTHMAVANQRWEAIAGMVSEIRSGTMCPVGIRVVSEVENLKTGERDQWTAINELRKLAKNAGMIIAGCGVVMTGITAGVLLYRQLWG